MVGFGIALWNEKDICPPPSYTHKTSKGNRTFIELRSACLQALSVLTGLDGLHDEAAVLSRMIYHLKCKLRSEKSFKAVEKVNRSLRRYLGLNMTGVYSNFMPREPERTEMQGYLPSRQMLEYVLVRTQSFAQLLRHTVDACEQAGRELAMKLAVGHMWCASLTLYAIVSRIWTYARYLVFSACEWFDKLKNFLCVLKPNPTPWLPEGYSFPSDLAGWLNIGTWKEAPRPTLPAPTKRLFSLVTPRADEENVLSVETESEDEGKSSMLAANAKEKNICITSTKSFSSDEQSAQVATAEVTAKRMKKEKKLKRRLKSNLTNTGSPANSVMINGDGVDDVAVETATCHHSNSICNGEDVGESVCRETIAAVNKTTRKHLTEVQLQSRGAKRRSIKAISSHEDLSALIQRENCLRGSQRSACLMSNLDKLGWRLLRKTMRKYVRKMEHEPSKKQYKKLLVEAKQILRHHVL